jgi:cytochrome c5
MFLRYVILVITVFAPQCVVAEKFADDIATRSLYQHNCFTCHGTGLPGVPQKGDSTEWQRRALQGKAVLYQHALEGFIGDSDMLMPPMGGNAELSETQVRQLVDYMLEEP